MAQASSHPLPLVDVAGNVLAVGANVVIKEVPDWLVCDLPLDEARALRELEGQTRVIVDVDASGYVWFGCSQTNDSRWFCLRPSEVLLVGRTD